MTVGIAFTRVKQIAPWIALIAFTNVQLRPSVAQDCPNAQSVKDGYIVERGDRSKTEVFLVENNIIRTVFRYSGSSMLETTQYQGLLQLDRVDRGRRTTYRPKTDLAAIFPLKAGQQKTIEFNVKPGKERANTVKVQLSVKSTDVLYIGPCKYNVLKIERWESHGDGPLRLINTDYYAPDIKLIIAKEYNDRDGRTTLIKFDKIYPLHSTKGQ